MGIFPDARGGFIRKLTVNGVIWVLSAVSVYGCDCSAPPVQEVINRADVVFRGTIIALRPSTRPLGWNDTRDTGKVAVFQVSRVWKGEVGPTFEMPALEELAACWGFWPNLLKVGNDLLVFAFQVPDQTSGTYIFETTICSRTALARGNTDLAELGAGHEPGRSPKSDRQRAFIRSALLIVVVGSLLSYILQRHLTARSANRISSVR
jgi:hypothetical protein